MKRFISCVIFFVAGFAKADVEVSEIHKFAVKFHGEDAKRFSQAFGIVEKQSDVMNLELEGDVFKVKASVTGSYSNGQSNYFYQASALLDAASLRSEGNVLSLTIAQSQAKKVFDALKGVKAVSHDDGVETWTKRMEFSKFRLACSHTSRSSADYECKIDFKKKYTKKLGDE